mmetsp:Transcript_47032/g.81846  ORF Transcript_47032/g.81846 Transcript_47032/m.81846 type:complete len:490 (+) Transcript_47032:146-1615(+)
MMRASRDRAVGSGHGSIGGRTERALERVGAQCANSAAASTTPEEDRRLIAQLQEDHCLALQLQAELEHGHGPGGLGTQSSLGFAAGALSSTTEEDYRLALQLQAELDNDGAQQTRIIARENVRRPNIGFHATGISSTEDDHRLALQLQAELRFGLSEDEAQSSVRQYIPTDASAGAASSSASSFGGIGRDDFARFSRSAFLRSEARPIRGMNLRSDPLAVAIRQEFLDRIGTSQRPAPSNYIADLHLCPASGGSPVAASLEQQESLGRRRQERRDRLLAERLDLEEQQEIHQRSVSNNPRQELEKADREVRALNDSMAAALAEQRAESMQLGQVQLRHRQDRQDQRERTLAERRRLNAREARFDHRLDPLADRQSHDRRDRQEQEHRLRQEQYRERSEAAIQAGRSMMAPQGGPANFKMEEVAPAALGEGCECSVCLEAITGSPGSREERAVELPCKHRFHQFCLGAWLASRPTCPLCRAAVPRVDAQL